MLPFDADGDNLSTSSPSSNVLSEFLALLLAPGLCGSEAAGISLLLLIASLVVLSSELGMVLSSPMSRRESVTLSYIVPQFSHWYLRKATNMASSLLKAITATKIGMLVWRSFNRFMCDIKVLQRKGIPKVSMSKLKNF